ncbi:MAG: thiolase family protein [Gammaproteobacteria bacterium]|nr:MAG: thiolase family protein [Gammaproteobacteria bacterium]
MTGSYIPYGAYWSSPFSRWQGSLQHLPSVEFAAHLTRTSLESRGITGEVFDAGVLGMTVPQQYSFYGLPWLAGMAGVDHIGGPTISQACATSARVLSVATQEVATGSASCVLAVTTDRLSNGPHMFYPRPKAPGGIGAHEDWVPDNMGFDPYTRGDMTQTAENCANKWNVSTAEQHEVVLRRLEQYGDALADDSAFLKRFMTLPFEVPDPRFKKTVSTMTGDEGIFQSTAEGLAKLRPVKEGGSITFGGQTHPADGAAGMVVTTEAKARELSADSAITIKVVAFGQARVEKSFMPAATIPASMQALERAGIGIADLAAIKSHNPFAVNDIVFARETGADLMSMNNYGSSLIWGHPQGPTGMRAMIELIEELTILGGGWGLFQGCAAGDTSMAVVLKVGG